jgi:hypothetical protein
LQGNERNDEWPFPDAEYRYYLCADRFGWTPEETDNQPAQLIDWVLGIAGVVEEVKAEKMKS